MTAQLARGRALLRQWQRRFDARRPRERVLLTVVVAAGCLMLADLLWLGDAFKAWQTASRRVQAAQNTIASLQADTAQIQANHSSQARAQQAELQSWRQRVRDADSALQSYQDNLVGPDRMRDLLGQLLARHGQLRVRSMQSLGRSDLLDAALSAATPGAAAVVANAGDGGSLYRHGVELTLEGSYADLLGYLNALEALPQRLLWGSVALKVEEYPRTVLTLRLYTISRDRHWLEI